MVENTVFLLVHILVRGLKQGAVNRSAQSQGWLRGGGAKGSRRTQFFLKQSWEQK